MRQLARVILKKVSRNFGDALIVLGIIVLSAPFIWSIRSTYLQEREEMKWENQIPQQANGPGQAGVLNTAWPPTKIVIDRIGLSAVVVEGKNDKDLERGPMHLAGTAGPGKAGNCCIAAHKEKWFKKLRDLRKGDLVVLKTHRLKHIYRVTGQETVSPSDISVLKQTPKPTITLITCTGVLYGGSKSRLIVLGTFVQAKPF